MRDGVIVGLANHTLLISKSGDERPIDDSAAPISIENEVVGSVLVFRDVTERRRTEEKLRANREQLERQAEELLLADRRKNDFLAMLAHELRNPLAPIRNSITVLQMKGPPDPELVWAREVIERQVTTMARLLDDLLDLNRLARQKLELRKEAIALETVIERAVETSRPLITSGRQDLRIDLPKEPLELEGDPIRLAQVFSNLLNNAAKYTDPGGQIAIKVMREDESAVVTVRDTGIGIEPEALPRIFEIFSQVPSARNRSEGGAGIGLSLANGIVVLHGGTIEARSAGLGKGSEFSVRLPLAPASRVPPQEVPKEEPIALRTTATRRVLIADDLRDSADSLAMMLRTVGHTVETAYDGEQALQSAGKWRPEVLLLDIGMPKLDGYEVCRQIRAEPWGEKIFIIAQTGWGQEDDLRLAREAGFDHHLVKPVSFPALLDVLARLERDGREGWRSKGEGDGKSGRTSE
jgi:signal transduction histidine kinase/ActR/RegA family two-component response regulator